MTEDLSPFTPEEARTLVCQVDVSFLLTGAQVPLEQLDTQLLERAVVEYGGLVDPVGQFQAWISSVISDFANWIAAQVTGAISAFTNTIISAFNQVIGPLRDALTKVVIPSIATFVQGVQDFFTKTLPFFFESAIKTIQGYIGNIVSALESAGSQLSDIVKRIPQVLSTISDTVSKLVSDIATRVQSQLTNIFNNVVNALQMGVSQLSTLFSNAAKTLQDIFANIQRTLGDLLSRIQSSLASIPSTLQSALASIQKGLGDLVANVQKVFQGVLDALKDVPSFIMKTVKDIQNFIWEHLPDWVKNFLSEAPKALGQVGVTIQGFVNSILRFPEWFPRWFYDHIARPISEALQSLAKWIWEHLPDWLRNALTTLGDILTKVWDIISKIPGAFWDFVTKTVPDFFTKTLPEWGKRIYDFFKGIYDKIKPVFERIWQWISVPETFWRDLTQLFTALAKWLWDAARGIWDAVQGALRWLTESFKAGLLWLKDVMVGEVEAIVELVTAIFREAKSLVVKYVGILSSLATELLSPLKDLILSWRETFAKMMRGEMGELETLVAMVLSIIPVSVLVYSSSSIYGALSHWGAVVREALEKGAEKIPYIGGAIAGIIHRIMAPINQAMYLMSRDISKLGERIPDWFGFAFAFAWSDAIKLISTWLWKRFFRQSVGWDLVFRLPSQQDVNELVVRFLPQMYGFNVTTPKYEKWVAAPVPRKEAVSMTAEDMFDVLQNYYDFYGYPDTFIKLFTAKPEEFYLVIRDRFGAERKVPLGALYQLPSFSDLAEMMVRDLFQSLDDFQAISLARGYYKDIAALYYVFHYKYPPLEKIWEFYSRAQAGLLWYRPTSAEMRDVQQAVSQVLPPDKARDYTPVPPVQLNALGNPDVAKGVLYALATYVKWYDYAPWSWIKGFTSDKWLMIDMLADIPMRIDARWMYKWMVPDYVGEIAGIRKMAAGPSLSEQVMGQVVIARGMNPVFVPMVTVAEMMNALTEERTVFRTGIINAFRRGFTTLDNMMKSLSGLFTLDFWTPVWNADKYTYEWKKVTVPVRFLEGEAKLLAMRALYDRADIYFREFRRQLIAMITDNYDSPERLPEFLKKVVDDLNKQLVQFAKAIGAEKAFLLHYDETMASFDKAYAELRNAHRTLTRGRSFLRSILYRLWQRFAAGYVSEEEMRDYIDDLVKEFKLTDAERDFFLETAQLFRELHRRQTLAKNILRKVRQGLITEQEAVEQLVKLGFDRETAQAEVEAEVKSYVPTISQLATLVELVPEAITLFDKVARKYGMTEEERKYWLTYIERKVVKDEVSRLVSELIMDYAKGVISDDEWKKLMGELRGFGYNDAEIQLLTMIAKLRRARYQKK